MKPQKFNKKLTLNKKTISNLQNEEMRAVYAGGTTGTPICWKSCDGTCFTCDPCTDNCTLSDSVNPMVCCC